MAQLHFKADTTAETAPAENRGDAVVGGSCEKVAKGAAGLDTSLDCAGEFTRAIAFINEPAYSNMLVIRNATSLQDAIARAQRCRSDASNVTFYTPAILACAPYIACQ